MRQMVREHFGDPDEFTGDIATDWGHRHEEVAIAEYELTRWVLVHHCGAAQQTLVHPDPRRDPRRANRQSSR